MVKSGVAVNVVNFGSVISDCILWGSEIRMKQTDFPWISCTEPRHMRDFHPLINLTFPDIQIDLKRSNPTAVMVH